MDPRNVEPQVLRRFSNYKRTQHIVSSGKKDLASGVSEVLAVWPHKNSG